MKLKELMKQLPGNTRGKNRHPTQYIKNNKYAPTSAEREQRERRNKTNAKL